MLTRFLLEQNLLSHDKGGNPAAKISCRSCQSFRKEGLGRGALSIICPSQLPGPRSCRPRPGPACRPPRPPHPSAAATRCLTQKAGVPNRVPESEARPRPRTQHAPAPSTAPHLGLNDVPGILKAHVVLRVVQQQAFLQVLPGVLVHLAGEGRLRSGESRRPPRSPALPGRPGQLATALPGGGGPPGAGR